VLVIVAVGEDLVVTPRSLHFGGSTMQRTFQITNGGTGTLIWDATPDSVWISVDPTSGTGDQIVTVTVDRCGIAPGTTRSGQVLVTSNGGIDSVSVTADWMPEFTVSPTFLVFDGGDPDPRTFQIQTACPGTSIWSLELIYINYDDWMTVTPEQGSGDATVTVTVGEPQGVPTEEPVQGIIVLNPMSGAPYAAVTVWWTPGGGLVPTGQTSWGRMKAGYRPKKEEEKK